MRDERWRAKYERQKSDLLSDASVCQVNRKLFADFFAYQEHKLKRINGGHCRVTRHSRLGMLQLTAAKVTPKAKYLWLLD